MTTNNDEYVFTEETMQSLRELGEILQQIHTRLVQEGIDIPIEPI
jgi:hypothetical protein